MRLNQVVIVPDLGWYAGSHFDPGVVSRNLMEIDIIDTYVRSMEEELRALSIPVDVLKTRSRPGITVEGRAKAITPHSLVVLASSGSYKGRTIPINNKGWIYYGGKATKTLAWRFEEILSEWGKRAHFHYVAGQPQQDDDDPILNLPDTYGVRVQPFYINGSGAQDLTRHLHTLGTDLGRLLAEYIRHR